jgi:hypothetical protein
MGFAFAQPILSAPFVTAGLDPAVHSELPHAQNRRMDARVKPAHDERGW